jgi:hypothetical protein
MANHAMSSPPALLTRQCGCFNTSAPFRRSSHCNQRRISIHALAQHESVAMQAATPDRRALLLGLGSLAAAPALPSYAAKETAQVGEYLPSALLTHTRPLPGPQDTPSLPRPVISTTV